MIHLTNNTILNNYYTPDNFNENTQEFMCLPQDSLKASTFYQEKSLHSREIDVQKLLGSEALQFDPKDPKPKLLYLMAKADDVGSFPINSPVLTIESFINQISPESHTNKQFSDIIKKLREHQERAREGDEKSILYLKEFEEGLNLNDHGIGRLLKILNKNFDLRFKVISTTQEMCEEISAASKINNLKSLIFSAHGVPNAITISDNELIVQDPEYPNMLNSGNYIIINNVLQLHNISNVDESCFSGLPPDATISLLSCHTGNSPSGIASTISRLSQLDVWAPRDQISSIRTDLSSDIPPIPTFWNARKPGNSFFDDHACKFSPDGSSKCGALNAKVLPVVMDYAPLVILGLAALYCVNKYIKPWIYRKVFPIGKVEMDTVLATSETNSVFL